MAAAGRSTLAVVKLSRIVPWQPGQPFLYDLILDTLREGQVLDSVENDKTASWTRENRAVPMPVMRQPGTNKHLQPRPRPSAKTAKGRSVAQTSRVVQ